MIAHHRGWGRCVCWCVGTGCCVVVGDATAARRLLIVCVACFLEMAEVEGNRKQKAQLCACVMLCGLVVGGNPPRRCGGGAPAETVAIDPIRSRLGWALVCVEVRRRRAAPAERRSLGVSCGGKGARKRNTQEGNEKKDAKGACRVWLKFVMLSC